MHSLLLSSGHSATCHVVHSGGIYIALYAFYASPPPSLSSYSFKFPMTLDVDHGIKVPSYFGDIDMLMDLVEVLVDEKVGMAEAEDKAPQEEDLMIIDEPKPKITLRKCRTKKLKEPLDVKFVRRSKRLNKELGGFRDEASAAAVEEHQEALQAIVPYEGKASSSRMPTPHLSIENVQGIATRFLQIELVVVIAQILHLLDDDN